MTERPRIVRALLAIAAALWMLPAVAAACTGDCNGDHTVSIDELVRGVAIGLDPADVESCPRFDIDRNREVSIDELIGGVGAALGICTTEIENVKVNDAIGVSETSIAVLGSNVVVGYNDRRTGILVSSGYAYSTDGGSTWTDGGVLPLLGPDDVFRGDPSVVACGNAVYYTSLYSPPTCSAPGVTDETEPNDTAEQANEISVGGVYRATIGSDADRDVVRFTGQAGTFIGAQLSPFQPDMPDAMIELLSGDGSTVLAHGMQGAVIYRVDTDGSYLLVVRRAQARAPLAYTLTIVDSLGCPSIAAGLALSRGTFDTELLSWAPPVPVHYAFNPVPGLIDKDYLTCDQSSGALYLAYVDEPYPVGSPTHASQIELVRSVDGGTQWSFPPTIVEPGDESGTFRQGPYPAVGPDGSVYVAWFAQPDPTTDSATIEVRKSIDGGASFLLKATVATLTVPNPDDRLDLPSIAIDTSGGAHRGTVYVAFADADRDEGGDIKLARSSDGGLSFDAPIRLNDDPTGADQLLPWVAVDPSDGTVSVIWYDRRFHVPPGEAWTDVFLTQSSDGGATWTRNRPITDVPSVNVGHDAGDYINAVAMAGTLYVAWTDVRNGGFDAYFARVPPLRP
jgi:hypothetical protein